MPVGLSTEQTVRAAAVTSATDDVAVDHLRIQLRRQDGRNHEQYLIRGGLTGSRAAEIADIFMFEGPPTEPDADDIELEPPTRPSRPATSETLLDLRGPDVEPTLLDFAIQSPLRSYIEPTVIRLVEPATVGSREADTETEMEIEPATELPLDPEADSTRFQRYLIAAPLGRYDDCELHFAYDMRGEDAPAPCVLRRLTTRRGGDWIARRTRFIAEAGLAPTLTHPNLVKVRDAGVHRGVPYIAREAVDGMNVRGLMALSDGAVGVRTAVTIAIRVARALDYAHRHNLVHGELCPTAVLLTKEGTVKITEVGVHELNGHPLTASTGGRRGEPGYRSPEQIADQPIDARSDVYQLGLLTAELLTGRALGLGEIGAKSLSVDVRQRLGLQADVPPALTALVAEMIAERPAKRPQTAHDVEQRLVGVQDIRGRAASLGPTVAPAFERARRRVIRERGPRQPIEVSQPQQSIQAPIDTTPVPTRRPTPRAKSRALMITLIVATVAVLTCLIWVLWTAAS